MRSMRLGWWSTGRWRAPIPTISRIQSRQTRAMHSKRQYHRIICCFKFHRYCTTLHRAFLWKIAAQFCIPLLYTSWRKKWSLLNCRPPFSKPTPVMESEPTEAQHLKALVFKSRKCRIISAISLMLIIGIIVAVCCGVDTECFEQGNTNCRTTDSYY